jgi:hypothetical protein
MELVFSDPEARRFFRMQRRRQLDLIAEIRARFNLSPRTVEQDAIHLYTTERVFDVLGQGEIRGVDREHAFAVLRDRAINDSDAIVRQWAVEGLRFFKTDDALDALFHSFTNDSNYSVRDRAGCNLSDCGIFTRAQRMRFVPKLVELAEDRNLNSQMRNWTFMALREITDASLPDDASAWRNWYKEHGMEKTAEFEALPWYQVRGDQ